MKIKLVFLLLAILSEKGWSQKNLQYSINKGTIVNPSEIISISDLSELRTLQKETDKNFYLLLEKGKEGFFKIDLNDKISKDNEGTIVVSKFGKRYKRIFEGEVIVTWFGAKGDGKTDDSEAFNKAILAGLNSIYIPYSQKGYRIANVVVSETVTLRGDNKFNSTIIPASNNVSCFITAAEFVEYKNLYFDGAGFSNTVGIEHKYKISTTSDCFFSGLTMGIFNNKVHIKGGKPDEQTITGCRFRNCFYGVFSDGHFINSKIINSIFHTCKGSAIFCTDESVNASPTTTEGLTIESCLIYDSGNREKNMAAIDLRNVDFCYVRNCMVDINTHTGLSLSNCQNCNVSGSYFSSAAATNASSVILAANCSNSTFEGCQFYDNKNWGLEIIGVAGRLSDNIRVNNCSGRLNLKGDVFINGGTNIWINNSNFYSNSSTTIQADNTLGNTSLYIRGTNIIGGLKRSSSSIIFDLKDCPTKPTVRLGMATIPDGKETLTFQHGLTVLPGQQVFVIAAGSSIPSSLSATSGATDIKLTRSGKEGELKVTYRAEVQ